MSALLSDAAFWITAGAILVLLVLSAFFSGSETALTAASRGKLRAAADRGTRGAARRSGSPKTTRNSSDRCCSATTSSISSPRRSQRRLLTRVVGANGVAAATLIMTLLVLIFAEVLPKTYAITNPERVASMVAPPIALVVRVFSPIVATVRLLVRGVLRLFGVSTDPDTNILAVREEIAGALSLGHSEGVVQKEDRDRILGALDLAERTVEEVMLHRSGISTIDADLPVLDILRLCIDSPHTRLPLWRGEPENIVGILHAKELLRAMQSVFGENGAPDADALASFDILSVAKKPYFTPEYTSLDDQMRQFLKRHTHFALVVDEYGDLQGLITLEDILEEIVGEIADEFDTRTDAPVAQTADGAFLVDGAMTIRDLNRAHDWQLPDDEANTVAGLVIHEAQMIPVEGQVFSFHGFRFEVVRKAENRIATLKIRPL